MFASDNEDSGAKLLLKSCPSILRLSLRAAPVWTSVGVLQWLEKGTNMISIPNGVGASLDSAKPPDGAKPADGPFSSAGDGKTDSIKDFLSEIATHAAGNAMKSPMAGGHLQGSGPMPPGMHLPPGMHVEGSGPIPPGMHPAGMKHPEGSGPMAMPMPISPEEHRSGLLAQDTLTHEAKPEVN